MLSTVSGIILSSQIRILFFLASKGVFFPKLLKPFVTLTFKSIDRKIKEGAIAKLVSNRSQTGATNT